jgi:hypothetical protein
MISLACLLVSATGFAFDLKCLKIYKAPPAADDGLSCTVHNKDALSITNRSAVMSPSQYDDNDEIKGLGMYKKIVHYIPKFTEKIAKRLRILFIIGCGLKEVRKEDFKQFPQLKRLILDDNDLEWLENDLFAFNAELSVISFFGNEKLKYIGANLFDSLSKLRDASFESAGCIEFKADDSEKLEELKTKLNTECKDEATKLKMLGEQTTTTTKTTTESLTDTTSAPSQADESPTEASV